MESRFSDSNPPMDLVPVLGEALKLAQARIQALEEALVQQRRAASSNASRNSHERAAPSDRVAKECIANLEMALRNVQQENSFLEERLQAALFVKPVIEDERLSEANSKVEALEARLLKREAEYDVLETQLSECSARYKEQHHKYKEAKVAKQEYRQRVTDLETHLEQLKADHASVDIESEGSENKEELDQLQADEITVDSDTDCAGTEKDEGPTKRTNLMQSEPPPIPKPQKRSSALMSLKNQYSRATVLLAKLPLAAGRPSLSVIESREVCRDERTLRKIVDSVLGVESSEHIFFFPERLRWAKRGSQATWHAIVFQPNQQLLVPQNTWRSTSSMNCLGGSTQRMFLEHSKGISYYGTYKCHPVPGVTVCPRDRTKLIGAIVAATIVGDRCPSTVREAVKELYKKGDLTVDYLAMQFILYDTCFNDALMNNRSILSGNFPGKRDRIDGEDVEGQPKTKRTK